MPMDAAQLDAWGRFFQTVGWPGIIYLTVIYGGYKLWTWHTTVKWPQEREDARQRAAETNARQDRWYAQLDKLIERIGHIYWILAAQYPQSAKAAADALKDGN